MTNIKILKQDISIVIPPTWEQKAKFQRELERFQDNPYSIVGDVMALLNLFKKTLSEELVTQVKVILNDFEFSLNLHEFPKEPKDGEPWPLDRNPNSEEDLARIKKMNAWKAREDERQEIRSNFNIIPKL